MTEPAHTVTADRLGGDVLLDMLERNVHHIPVLSPAGEVLGVVDDGDLVAAEGRKPLLLRRAIALAESRRRAGGRGGRAGPGDHRAARRAGDGRAPDGGPFGRPRRADPAAGRAGRPGRRAAARAVHLVRAWQPGAPRGGAVLRRGQRAGLGRRRQRCGTAGRGRLPGAGDAGGGRGPAGVRAVARRARAPARPTRCSPGRWPRGTGPRGACPRIRPRRRR